MKWVTVVLSTVVVRSPSCGAPTPTVPVEAVAGRPACPELPPLDEPVASGVFLPYGMDTVRVPLRDDGSAAFLAPGTFVDVVLVPFPDGTGSPVRTIVREGLLEYVGWPTNLDVNLRVAPNPTATLLVEAASKEELTTAVALGTIVLSPSDGGGVRCDPELQEFRQWVRGYFRPPRW